MQKIVPHLWYDREAEEAAKFYVSLFKDSSIKSKITLTDTPSGDADMLTIVLAGQEFMLISAGPYFKFTPAVSFVVSCSTLEETEALWNKLQVGGKQLSPWMNTPSASSTAGVRTNTDFPGR